MSQVMKIILFFTRKKMNLPIEVWVIVFTYLRLKFLVFVKICITCVKKNSFYVRRLLESKKILKDKDWLLSHYSKLLENFNNCVFKDLASIVSIKNLLEFKKTPYKKLCYSLLPFCVWNHIFLCCRSQYESIMCLFCTKLHLRNKKNS